MELLYAHMYVMYSKMFLLENLQLGMEKRQ